MKQLNTYNRAAGYLNKIFDLLNEEFFDGELPRPTITIQSTPRAYGHFTLNENSWLSNVGGTHEINIGAGTLSRPIEDLCATLLHESVHYYCHLHGIKDTSNGYVYHNRRFRDCAEAHGLIVEHHDKYGWTITSPSEELIDFCIKNDLTEILISRNEGTSYSYGGSGAHNGTSGNDLEPPAKKKSSTRKYICPRCGMSVRATKVVRISCIDCDEQLIEA